MTRRAPLWLGLGLVAAGLVILVIGAVAGMTGPVGPSVAGSPRLGSMMGRGPVIGTLPGPDSPGFVPGTAASPRVVQITATPRLRFVPETVIVKQGETVTFQVTSIGPITHEFMVGPAADVAADKAGTPEIADVGMMETRSLTYTFDGRGPYAFACHAPGHYEAGMSGTIAVVP
ncbi:MAG TPA: plastocyanin/azurin family copper-binding protein [Candidatus Limnocylindrales bacterium]|jgi:plastocyanin